MPTFDKYHVPPPKLIEFEADSLTECKTEDESLDELQALNTALCFLCSINADWSEVETFLTQHPDALLLEGTGNLPEESAHFIVSEQMNRCECFTASCNQNRLDVLEVLDRGFEHYQSNNFWSSCDCKTWEKHATRLLTVERDIRQLRTEEILTRHRLLETVVQVRGYQDALEQVTKYEDSKQSALSMLACTRKSDLFARQSILEYQVGVASVNLSSVEREHKVLLSEIRHGRRVQFATLKKVFKGCNRHVCVVSKPTQHNKLSV